MIHLEPVWRKSSPPLVRVLDSLVGHVARDVTASSAYRSCVVLSPHPDDETLGCAATIMRKLAAGTPVDIGLATDGGLSPKGPSPEENIALRQSEFRQACRVLGLEDGQTHMMHFSDGALHLAGDDLVDAISDLLEALRPDEVVTTSPTDPHGDHAALGMAALTALSGRSARLLTFPVWQQALPRHWKRTELVLRWPEAVRTGDFLERKREALAAYRSQFPALATEGIDAGAALDTRFLRLFLGGHEVFFPVAWK